MLKLEHVALELFEYKVEEVRARRTVRGGLASVWALYHHLHRQLALLAPDERRRLELAERILRHVSEASSGPPSEVTEFSDLVLGGELGEESSEPPISAPAAGSVAPPTLPSASSSAVSAEQAALQNLAAKVWRHDLDRFIRRIAGGLRAERDRYTARLLYAVQRNIHLNCQGEEQGAAPDLERFAVVEAMPAHDDPFLSVNDVDSLAELVRETIDCVLSLADRNGPYSSLGVVHGAELSTMRALARKVAADPYAGRTGLLEQRGPNAQQLRVAMQELGKERLRDEERLSQRQQLEERLQRVLAFERNQRQLFHQDVARFESLMDAFYDRLARYLPTSVGGLADPPRLAGGVLFAVNPALRIEVIDPHVPGVTARLKGPTRMRVAGLEVSVSGPGPAQKLYLRGEEHRLAGELAVSFERKWLYAFSDGEYLHLKVEDEARSVVVRVAEAAVAVQVMSSPERRELQSVLRVLADGTAGEAQELVKAALQSVAALTAKAPDRAVAVEGFLRGSARAAKVELTDATVAAMRDGMQRALSVDGSDLTSMLERVDLGEVSVHTLTGEPLALEVGTYGLTVRQYRVSGDGNQESLVVMLPGHALGTFDEYLIEPLGDGLLVCVKGEQELVVGYLRSRPGAARE